MTKFIRWGHCFRCGRALWCAMLMLIYLLGINILTYGLYWHDKAAARRQESRVPEFVLLFFGFIGGTVAAFVAQRVLRHKIRKRIYQFKFWSLTAIQIWLLCSPPAILRPLISHLF